MGLGVLGTLVPLYEKSYGPSWKTNGFLKLSQAFTLLKSSLQGPWVRCERLKAAYLAAWFLLNFTQGLLPSLIFRPDNFSYAIVPLIGAYERTSLLCLTLGLG
jgi:hypothetical protein